MNVSRHDPDLGFSWGNQPGAVWPNQAGISLLEEALDPNHVQNRHTFGNTNDQSNIGIGRLHDRIGGKTSRNINNAGIGLGGLDGFPNRIKDGDPMDPFTAFTGGYTANHFGAILHHLLGMESAFASGNALD
jgi:hypothetical protein